MAQGEGSLIRRVAGAAAALLAVALAVALAALPAGAAPAQQAPRAMAAEPPPTVRPAPRPAARSVPDVAPGSGPGAGPGAGPGGGLAAPAPVPPEAAEGPAARPALIPPAGSAAPDPGRGAVTGLALPRYVSLKTGEGNARRGPGLTHRIDWTFTRAGMPLRITAEFENWRRVEDAEGAGGWVHYSLLSGTRTVLVTETMAEFRAAPEEGAAVLFQAEAGVVGRLIACRAAWCRVAADGRRGWVAKRAIWGVDPGEILG